MLKNFPRTLGIIPARGGSKGIPHKNLFPLLGKPLIAYSILSAKKSKHLSRLIVSTDSDTIAKVATDFGADVPFIRPQNLASDTALSVEVVKHAVHELEKQGDAPYDYVVLLQPTTPLRRAEDIDAALEKLHSTKCDSIVSFVNVGAHHPARMYKIENDILTSIMDEKVTMRPRQELPDVFIRSGDIYASTTVSLLEFNTLMGRDTRPVILPSSRSVNIDSRTDLYLAEHLLALDQEGKLT